MWNWFRRTASPLQKLTSQQYEQLAERHLRRLGYRPLARNFNATGGELDLVMRDGEDLVFVEVRMRSSEAFGSPAETVDAAKQSRVRKAAYAYLDQHPRHRRLAPRFDVVAIVHPDGQPPRLEHIPNAF